MSIEKMLDVVLSMRNNRLSNYIVAGLTSHLVGDQGDKFGKVRLFSADRSTRDAVTPHSHRFDFACLVLRGYVNNTLYEQVEESHQHAQSYCLSTIDQVCGLGGIRKYDHIRYTEPLYYQAVSRGYAKGQFYFMASDQIHSIVFGKDTDVLFIEGPAKTQRGLMLEPWVNGKCVPTFKTEDWMFERD